MCAMCWTVVCSISALRDSKPFLLVMAAPPSFRMMVGCLVGSDDGDVKFMKNFPVIERMSVVAAGNS